MTRHRWTEVVLTVLSLALVARADAVTITGTVVDSEGNPVTDATVFTRYYARPRPEARLESVHISAKADERGEFRLVFEPEARPGVKSWTVTAFSAPYALTWQDVPDGASCTLRLTQKPVPCAGIVLDDQGQPISGAQVSVSSLDTLNPYRLETLIRLDKVSSFSSGTDDAGRFRINNLPAGVNARLLCAAEGKVRSGTEFDTTEPRQLVILMLTAGGIQGRVVHNGEPVSDVQVFCASADGWSRNDAASGGDGLFALSGLGEGAYVLVIPPANGLVAVALEDVVVTSGEVATVPDIELIEGGIVEGEVTQQGMGKPEQRLTVQARGPGHPAGVYLGRPADIYTDATGRYRLLLPPGTSQVRCSTLGGWSRCEPQKRSVNVEAGKTVRGVDFMLIPDPPGAEATIVEVFYPDGARAPGVPVSTQSPGDYGVVEKMTDAYGRAEVGGTTFAPGRPWQGMVVLARDPAKHLAGLVEIETQGGLARIDLALGAYAVGKATDADGKPLPGAEVRVHLMRDCLLATSDENGNLRIGPLPAGVPLCFLAGLTQYSQLVDHGWPGVKGLITLAAGHEYTLPTLRLNPQGMAAEGRVLAADGAPVAGALVGIAVGSGEPQLTDAEGRFRFEGLGPNTEVTFLAVLPGKGLYGAATVGRDAGYEPEIMLAPPTSARGRIAKPDGQPVANLALKVYANDLNSLPRSRFGLPPTMVRIQSRNNEVHTDDQGVWQVDNLIAGLKYLVDPAQPPPDPTLRTRWVTTEFVAVGGQTVEVEVPQYALERRQRGQATPRGRYQGRNGGGTQR